MPATTPAPTSAPKRVNAPPRMDGLMGLSFSRAPRAFLTSITLSTARRSFRAMTLKSRRSGPDGFVTSVVQGSSPLAQGDCLARQIAGRQGDSPRGRAETGRTDVRNGIVAMFWDQPSSVPVAPAGVAAVSILMILP